MRDLRHNAKLFTDCDAHAGRDQGWT